MQIYIIIIRLFSSYKQTRYTLILGYITGCLLYIISDFPIAVFQSFIMSVFCLCHILKMFVRYDFDQINWPFYYSTQKYGKSQQCFLESIESTFLLKCTCTLLQISGIKDTFLKQITKTPSTYLYRYYIPYLIYSIRRPTYRHTFN